MGLEMELYTDTRLEEDVKRSLVYKKNSKENKFFRACYTSLIIFGNKKEGCLT